MENIIKPLLAAGSIVASFLFGGWSPLLNVLLAFVIIDYASGVAAAAKEGKLSSKTGGWGIAKKVMTFAIVAVAHMVDSVLGDAHLFRDAAIFFYLTNELLSLLENAGRLGASIPPGMKKAIAILKGRSGAEDKEVEQ
ncbi:Holin family protein [compost metagenome]